MGAGDAPGTAAATDTTHTETARAVSVERTRCSTLGAFDAPLAGELRTRRVRSAEGDESDQRRGGDERRFAQLDAALQQQRERDAADGDGGRPVDDV